MAGKSPTSQKTTEFRLTSRDEDIYDAIFLAVNPIFSIDQIPFLTCYNHNAEWKLNRIESVI